MEGSKLGPRGRQKNPWGLFRSPAHPIAERVRGVRQGEAQRVLEAAGWGAGNDAQQTIIKLEK